MPIDATQPTVLQVTYPYWAIAEFRTMGDGCAIFNETQTHTVSLFVKLVKYRIRDDGVSERSPLSSDIRQLQIDDLYAEASVNQSIANILQTLVTAVYEYTVNKGIL